MKDNIVREKTYGFALRIIKLYKYMVEEQKEYVISKQLLKSGTSIGANVEEAIGGESRKDFLHKMSIAYKEARETNYWLRLARDSGYLTEHEISSLLSANEEILKLLGSITKTTISRIRIRN